VGKLYQLWALKGKCMVLFKLSGDDGVLAGIYFGKWIFPN
jgi:hypothetical protein